MDLLGERWTLLIIRDLLVSPRRYSDLLDGLPGIGTNLLAERLKMLEGEGLVYQHLLPPPADRVTVYNLTAVGRELEPVLHALVRWSWRHLGSPRSGQRTDPRWTVLALRATFDPDAARGLDATYVFEISGTSIWMRIVDQAIETGLGTAEDPDVVVRADDRTLARIRAGDISVADAVEQGQLEFEGPPSKIDRMFKVLSRR